MALKTGISGRRGTVAPNDVSLKGSSAGMILTLMAQQKGPLHELVSRIPAWQAIKSKLRATEGSPDALRALFTCWKLMSPKAELRGNMLHLSSPEGDFSLSLHPDEGLTMSGHLPNGENLQARCPHPRSN